MEQFELQVKMFTDQLVDLIEQAKDQASLEFASERSNWEQTERSFLATIRGMENEIDAQSKRAGKAEQELYDLRAKLASL